MTLSAERLRALFAHHNIKAMYAVVRRGESSLDERAYRMISGGGEFFDFSRHPYAGLSTKQGGKAAGAPQFIPSTWAEVAELYSLPDFSPDSQDMGFVARLVYRKAIEPLMAGDFAEAIRRCKLEWTSLPGASENNPKWNYAAALALYLQHGGTLGQSDSKPADTEVDYQPAAPIVDHSPTLPETKVDPLSAIALFGPLISSLIPQIARLFDRKAETPEKIEAAQKAIDVLVASTGTPNVQAALEKISSDKVALAAATQAIVTEPLIMGLLEVGGGIERAREQVKEMAALPPQRNVALLVAGATLPLVYIVVVAVVFGFGGGWSDEMRSVVVTAIVTGLLGSITGFFLGSSYGSSRKNDLLNEAKNG